MPFAAPPVARPFDVSARSGLVDRPRRHCEPGGALIGSLSQMAASFRQSAPAPRRLRYASHLGTQFMAMPQHGGHVHHRPWLEDRFLAALVAISFAAWDRACGRRCARPSGCQCPLRQSQDGSGQCARRPGQGPRRCLRSTPASVGHGNHRRIRELAAYPRLRRHRGMVYHSLLSGKRTAAVQMKSKTELAALRAKPDAQSPVTAQLQSAFSDRSSNAPAAGVASSATVSTAGSNRTAFGESIRTRRSSDSCAAA